MIENDTAPIQEQDLRILKAITSDQKLAFDFVNANDANLFLGPAKQVGQAVIDYIKQYRAIPTKRVLADKYKTNPALCQTIESAFDSFTDISFQPAEYAYDIEKFRQRYVDTKFNGLRDNLRFSQNNVTIDSILQEMESTLKDIKRVKEPKKESYTRKSIAEYLPEFKEKYIAKIENPEKGQGVLTGYSYLDYICNGLSPSQMLIIGGDTAAGKSVFLSNLAIQMWMQQNTITTDPSSYTRGYNVLYFSLEMPYDLCYRRTLARLADVPIYGLRDSKLTKQETESLNLAARFINKYSAFGPTFDIVDMARGASVEQIEEVYLEACRTKVPDVVVVDYLGLLEDPEGEGDDWLKLGRIAGKLHEFARVHKTRVMTAVQLNRPNKSQKDPGDLIGIHRIGRSSLIMHNADIGIQIEVRPDEQMRDTFVYHIIKNRDGELGKHEVRKKFAHGAILDLPYMAPDRDEFGTFVSGFENEDDISGQVRKILGLQ